MDSAIASFSTFDFRGADVNVTDYRGLTPLKLSKRYGQDEISEILMEKGAKLEVEAAPKTKCAFGVDPPWKRKTSRRDEVTFGN